MKFLIMLIFVGYFCPPGSGSEFRIRIRIRNTVFKCTNRHLGALL